MTWQPTRPGDDRMGLGHVTTGPISLQERLTPAAPLSTLEFPV